MIQYEVFRQSVAGWAFLASLLLMGHSYIDFSSLSDLKWVLLFGAGLLSSPVFGYLVGQIIRAFYVLTDLRPNDTRIELQFLHSEFSKVISLARDATNPVLAELSRLSPKELHRVVWVAAANDHLRARSESYWERYYTNLGVILSIISGYSVGFLLFFKHDLLARNVIIKTVLLVVLVIAIRVANREYTKISAGIENSWIRAFVARLRSDPDQIVAALFAR